ncbi:MAG: helix-turn-helix domain-containing protein [Acidimicrobiales bacterium]
MKEPQADLAPHLLSIEQVAQRLGVTVRHVRRLVFERRIPYVKWGHLLRFEPRAVNRFIDEHTHHPATATSRSSPRRSTSVVNPSRRH